jgi:hypothetical protein
MATNQQEKEAQRNEMMEYLFLGLLALFGLIYVIYEYYIDVWYHTKLWTFWVLSLPPADWVDKALDWLRPGVGALLHAIHDDMVFHANDYFVYYRDTEVGMSKVDSINTVSRWFVFFIFAPFILYYLGKEFRRKASAIPLPRTAKHPMYAYARSQAQIWPYIKPVIGIMEKIVRTRDLDKSWYALSKLPLTWMKDRDLIAVVSKKKRRNLFTVSERREIHLNTRKSYASLKENLGKVWTGLDDLTFEQRCLAAVIIPHIYGRVADSRRLNRKLCFYHETFDGKPTPKQAALVKRLGVEIKEEVDNVLNGVAKPFSTPYFDASEFDDPYDPIESSFQSLTSEDEMFRKGDALIRDVLLKHAYVKTVFCALLERSWTYGVLASSELNWVKKVDRDLFYVISQQGRLASFVEVCGAWAHYLAEDTYGFKVLAPQVLEGQRGLDKYMFKTHANYSPCEIWEDASKWDKLVPDVGGSKANLPKASFNTTGAQDFV